MKGKNLKSQFSPFKGGLVYRKTKKKVTEVVSLVQNTLQTLYSTVLYNTVLDITRFKDGSQKCIDYIEK